MNSIFLTVHHLQKQHFFSPTISSRRVRSLVQQNHICQQHTYGATLNITLVQENTCTIENLYDKTPNRGSIEMNLH